MTGGEGMEAIVHFGAQDRVRAVLASPSALVIVREEQEGERWRLVDEFVLPFDHVENVCEALLNMRARALYGAKERENEDASGGGGVRRR